MLISVSFFCGDVIPFIDFSLIGADCIGDLKTYGDWFGRALGLTTLCWLSGPALGTDANIFQTQAVIFNIGIWIMEIHFTFFMPPFSGMILAKFMFVLLTIYILPINILALCEVKSAASNYTPVMESAMKDLAALARAELAQGQI